MWGSITGTLSAQTDVQAAIDANGVVDTGSNLGSGSEVFKQLTAKDLEFRSLTATRGVVLTEGATDVDIALPTGTLNDHLTYNGTNWVGAPLASSLVQTVTVSLNTAEVKTLFSAPYQLVAAPGVNKTIIPVSTVVEYTHVTTSYATADNMAIKHDGAALLKAGVLAGISLTGTSNDTNIQASYTSNTLATSTVQDKALMFYAPTQDPTLGDGTIKLIIAYYIADFS